MASLRHNIRVGTSGWSYRHWLNEFYPPGLPSKQHLTYYSTQFRTVEINLTFYRLPPERLVEGWACKAPPGFVYSIKGSRFVTHMKKLVNLDDALDNFFGRIEPLAARIGIVFWQLPPSMPKDLKRLDDFLSRLPHAFRHAVEFRHPSWLSDQTFDLLSRRNTAHVSVSSMAMPMNLTVTTDVLYLRFHGLRGGCSHDYTREELEPWAEHVRASAAADRTVYAYFNNDCEVRAPANAKTFMDMIRGGEGAPVPD